jgi:hypothetical protein
MHRAQRRLAPVAVLLAVAVGAAGCGGSQRPDPDQPPVPTPPPTDSELIRALLDRRADAIADGDLDAIDATVVPARRRADRAVGRVVVRLGLREPRYVVKRLTVDGRRASARVRFAYGVRGVEGEFGSERTLTVRRTPRGWRLAGVQGVRNVDPWSLGRYRRATTPHFVVWTPGDLPVPEAALEAGYARMQDVLKRGRLRDRYLVVVAADGRAAMRMTRTITGLESLTALTDTQVRVQGRAMRVVEIRSQRLILVNSRFGTSSPEAQQQIITHELTHAALAPQTSGRVPSWLVEGIAEYISEDDRREEADYYRSLGAAPTLASLSLPGQIGSLTGDLQSAAYAEASSAAYNISERYGRDKLIELYLAFNDPDLRGVPGPRLVQRAMKRVLGIQLEDLQ